ncbi:DUF4233 domain-containing protein [Litorihabitans aurantiacus]|uniref:DUF4233 domain-containing protein n=1 Tax=Litorihabitans aurantiacus TaxID=1930061 RepID=A0AA37XEI7_9MICO|nr:DUF4233 domain-containing protein [Litorihabitans aurantiacus]GMA31833.1 hypothetical protein GCM10025875_18250 [Litorihabitans aurantiacus]
MSTISQSAVPESAPDPSTGQGSPEVPAAPKPPRSARRLFCSTLLGLEAFVVFFAALTAYGLRAVDTGVILGVGIGGALACILAAGLLRSFVGYLLGTFIQGCLVAVAFLVPPMRDHMLAVGLVFAVLWVICWRVGARIDVEREERYAAELAHARANGTDGTDGTDGSGADGRVEP